MKFNTYKIHDIYHRLHGAYRKAVFKKPETTFAIIAALCAIILFVSRPQTLSKLNYYAYDTMLPLRKGKKVDVRLPVIVDIDRATADAYGQYPLPRYAVADLLDKLNAAGVAAIGVDINLSDPDFSSPQEIVRNLRRNRRVDAQFSGIPASLSDYDLYLAKAVERTPTVLASYSEREMGTVPPDTQTQPVKFIYNFISGDNPAWQKRIDQLPNVVFPMPKLADKAPVGLVDFNADQDGIVRRVPLFLTSGNTFYPTLVIRTLMRSEKTDSIILNIGRGGIESATIGRHSIPVGNRGNIRFPFKQKSRSYDYVSAIDVLNDETPKSLLEGRMAFVGSSSMMGLDTIAQPFNRFYPSIELHAATIDSIISQNGISVPRSAVLIQILLILAAAAFQIFMRRKFGFSMYAATTLGVAAIAAIMFSILFSHGLFLSPVWLLLTLLLMLVVDMCVFAVRSVYERNSIYRTFSKYISSNIVKRLVRTSSYRVGGAEKNLSIMFTDIRHFSQISESMLPNDLVSLLNHYFTFTSNTVKKYNGTVDKFLGDGMLAFWNAPGDTMHHQRLSVKAALDMQAFLPALNREIREKFGMDIEIGIALNAAPTFVGNVGSKNMMAYTIIGDSVNLTSRLEALSKVYGVGIVTTESVRNACQQDFHFRYLDKVRVYGKSNYVKIYEPISLKDAEIIEPELKKHAHAINLYLSMNFTEAAKAFRTLLAARPDSCLYKLYAERSEELAANPPEQDWDGSVAFANK